MEAKKYRNCKCGNKSEYILEDIPYCKKCLEVHLNRRFKNNIEQDDGKLKEMTLLK